VILEFDGSDVFFPIGNSSYNPATLNNSGIPDNFQARVFDQVFQEGTTGALETENVVGRTWMLSEEATGGSDLTTTLQWESTNELTSFDRSNCGVAHHLSGSIWENPPIYSNATTVGATTWSQTRGGFTSFSPFVVRDLMADLPIELLEFKADRIAFDQVYLDWKTSSELNNKGCYIERMLANETEFTILGFVEGNGTTTSLSSYNFIDNNSYADISYYRLKQIDFDGTHSYSPIRAVAGEAQVKDLVLFPNPTRDVLNLHLGTGYESEQALLTVFASDGKRVIQQTINIEENKTITITATQKLIAGMYLLHLNFGDILSLK